MTFYKEHNTITGRYIFIFDVPNNYGLSTDFDIVTFNEQSFGYEDQDELSIYPSTIKFTITDFNWQNFLKFKRSKDEESFSPPNIEIPLQGYYYFPIKITVYLEQAVLGKYIIADVEQNYEDYTLDLTISSGVEKLKTLNVNNPYFVRRLQSAGYLKPEAIRLMHKSDGEWFSNEANVDLAGAFGEIREYSGITGLGFTAYETGTNVYQMHVAFDDPYSYGSLITASSALISNRVSKQIGQMKALGFIQACAQLINPDCQVRLDNNLRFGNEDTSTTKDMNDIWVTKIYRLIFGRVVVLRKSFYNLYINKSHPFLRHIDVQNQSDPEIPLIPDENNLYDVAMQVQPELIWDDDNYIAWDISGAGCDGSQNKAISETLKDFCKSFYSGIDYKNLEEVVFYKRGLKVPGTPNPFGDGDGFGEGNLISLRKRNVVNRKTYVNISYLDSSITATKGRFSPYEEELLSYDLKYSAQKGSNYTVAISGFGGLTSFGSPNGGIISGAGSYIQSSAPDQGNIFFYDTGDTIRYATKIIDSQVPSENKLNSWVAYCEYETRKNNRPNYDIEAWGLDYKMDTIYQINPNSSNNFDEIKKVRPTEIVLNREKNTTKITAIEVL